ncbi:MAG: hypothetical protein C0631_16770 [Sedimenticola sp.]|jgi:hypothetical protein|nr:MAG: hypothetical protein C0631_16770 [Sedimenticola sp.]
MKHIEILLQESAPSYQQAVDAVRQLSDFDFDELMLLGWYDRSRDVGYPEAYECSGDKPGWLAYAEGHGANLRVDINQGSFVLLYLDTAQ